MQQRRRGPALLGVLLVACGGAEAGGEAALDHLGAPIIGGEPPAPGAHVAIGALLWEVPDVLAEVRCSGSLIAPDVVLAAAHCLIVPLGGALPAQLYFSTAGDVSAFAGRGADVPARSTPARAWIGHPAFDPEVMPPDGLADLHDVGLVFLAEPVRDVAPLALARPELAPLLVEGATVAIVGYGVRAPGGVDVGVRIAASSRIDEVGAAELQIGEEGPRKCRGDSGGPTLLDPRDGLVPAARVIGVSSRAYDATDCARGAIDVRVDVAFDWIAGEMIEACADGRRVGCAGDGAPLLPAPPVTVPPGPEPGGCACWGTRRAPPGALMVVGAMLLGLRARRRSQRWGAERAW